MINCKACGKPIKNEKDAEIFEGMHWLCFHLLFEHDGFDPDEPCDDPSCPWNRISGETTHIVHSYSDVKIVSDYHNFGIYLNLKSYESRMPSYEFDLSLVDELLRSYDDTVWFEEKSLITFCDNLNELITNLDGSIELCTMSPDDFKIKIKSLDSAGHYFIEYEINSRRFGRNTWIPMQYKNTSEINIQTLEKIRDGLHKVFNRQDKLNKGEKQ